MKGSLVLALLFNCLPCTSKTYDVELQLALFSRLLVQSDFVLRCRQEGDFRVLISQTLFEINMTFVKTLISMKGAAKNGRRREIH